jgi:hypothetical protein
MLNNVLTKYATKQAMKEIKRHCTPASNPDKEQVKAKSLVLN